MTRLLAVFVLLVPFLVQAQAPKIPEVPSKIEVAGMRLKITESGRRDIQKDVDALRKSSKYFKIKLDRVRLYFPLIEKVLEQEGVPDDFKYLSVQESALISDAVSASDAVGFWQFKDFTGREVGLRIDRQVDERLNVVASTHGAAKYFKRHNFLFKNWIYTVLAHMTGAEGAKKYIDTDKYGAQKMTITAKTHWYVKRFIAHKIAFQAEVGGKNSEGWALVDYRKGGGKTLRNISKKYGVDENELKKYNKWLKRGAVPEDKEYAVIVPVRSKVPKDLIAADKPASGGEAADKEVVVGADLNTNKTIFIKLNMISAMLAKSSQTAAAMAVEGGISLEKFLKYNDMKSSDAIIEGNLYYLRAKKNRAKVAFHTTLSGETMWAIAQKYGIKLKKLAKKNRMEITEQPKLGQVMWLRKTRPRRMPVEIKPLVETEKPDSPSSQPPEEGSVAVDMPQQRVSPPAAADSNSDEQAEDMLIHRVIKGETLYSIAKRYGIELSKLMSLNGTSGSIAVGQELRVPKSRQPSTVEESERKNAAFHVVESGDTLYKISRKYKISVDKLLELNRKNDFDISIGEKLRVKE